MPAQISFFDMEASAQQPNYGEPVPVTLGPNWQPHDIRVWCNFWFFNSSDPNTGTWYYGNQGSIPTGFVAFGPGPDNLNSNNEPTEGYGAICWRRLLPGDTDTFVVIPPGSGASNFDTTWPGTVGQWASALFTVRGVDPNTNPTLGALGPFAGSSTPLGVQHPVTGSITVPRAGTMAFWVTSAAFIQNPNTTNAFTFTLPGSLGCPTGWTNLVATSNSGATFYAYDDNPSSIVVAKSFSAAGSTGTVTFPDAVGVDPTMQGLYAFFTPAPDVHGTSGNASATSSSAAATAGGSTTVIGTAGSCVSTSSASTAFSGTDGYFVSDPLTLSGNPVTGSVVRWDADIPRQSDIVFETSINNGASWDAATNESSVARLHEGDTATRSVLVRATFSRQSTSGQSPNVNSLYLAVSTDAGVTELVPVGHGMIDKVTVHTMGGTTGSGSSTNVAGSTAVTSRGGGQTGGGTVLKIHANDLSYAIKRNVWQMPYTVSGMNYGDAIKAMVLDRLPDQTAFNIATTTRICPLLVYGLQQGGDPWQDVQELAQAIGWECFFDATGIFVARPVPDPRIGEPVWTFDEDDVILVAEAERELSSDQTFNDIVVIGQSTSSQNPFSAESYDDDASSPTYILGPYGRVTQRLTFSQITSQDQAQETADTALLNSLGAADTVTLTVVPHPALEPGDIVRVNCSNVKANGTYMINSLTMPLSPADPMQITCFRQSTSL